MCQFFSFITEPECHGGQRFYFDWDNRQQFNFDDRQDSHLSIAKFYLLNEDKCNKYEYNPLTGAFKVDQINSEVDDSIQAEEWVRKLDFKKIVEPLIIKPIIHPLMLPKVEKVTEEQIDQLKQWASVWDLVWVSVWVSVRDSVGDSVRASVGVSVGASVGDSVGDSVGVSVGASVGDSVGDSVWAYISSFFAIKYDHDLTPCIKLWETGLVPSFDGTTWRLHSGEKADVVYEWTPESEVIR
jgi:hypothetical protein